MDWNSHGGEGDMHGGVERACASVGNWRIKRCHLASGQGRGDFGCIQAASRTRPVYDIS